VNDVRDRLVGCFQGAFPALSRDAAIGATVENVKAWDSLKNFLLLTVIEEEFQLQIPQDDLDQLRTFAEIESYIASKTKG